MVFYLHVVWNVTCIWWIHFYYLITFFLSVVFDSRVSYPSPHHHSWVWSPLRSTLSTSITWLLILLKISLSWFHKPWIFPSLRSVHGTRALWLWGYSWIQGVLVLTHVGSLPGFNSNTATGVHYNVRFPLACFSYCQTSHPSSSSSSRFKFYFVSSFRGKDKD